jgi:uncharacterized alkaline shock family protein YloU
MELATIRTINGNVNISRITIEALIFMVLQEIKGIVCPKKTVFHGMTKKIIKNGQDQNEKNALQEIRIEIKPDSIIINLFLVVHYGIRIPDLTWEIQAKVREKIKETIGLEVEKINVHIQGIRYPRKYQDKNKLVVPEMFVKIF